MKRLGMVHTVTQLAPVFADLTGELLPGVETVVIADEMLLKRTVRDGQTDDLTRRRLEDHVATLAEFGVDAVLVTCSSVGDLVDDIASRAAVPVLRVDRAMAEQAVRMGSSVGVLATLPTTLAPTTRLIEAAGQKAEHDVVVVPLLCEGAFDALGAGDTAGHDRIVADHLERLAGEVDVIALAQASMARVSDARPAGGTPVLSSPRLAVEHLAKLRDLPLIDGYTGP